MSMMLSIVVASSSFVLLGMALVVWLFTRQRRVVAYNRRGLQYKDWDMWDEAIVWFERALRIDPHCPATRYNLGFALYHGKQQIGQAEFQLREALKSDPDLAAAHYVLGHLLFHKRKQIKEARTHLGLACDLDHGMAEPYNTLGLLEISVDNWHGAHEMFRKAVETGRDHATAWCNCAIASIYQGRNAEAIECAERYAELVPDSVLARKNLGNIYGACGRRAQAADQLRRAAVIAPGDWIVHFWLGCVYMQMSEPRKAISSFFESLRLHRDFALAHYNLALCFEVVGQKKLAKKHIDYAIELNPELGIDLI